MPAPLMPSLYERAEQWHRCHVGIGCSCLAAGCYPCNECRQEISVLLDLLDVVARDAILATSSAYTRLQTLLTP